MANLYVRSTDGSDADNGTTWALAKATLAGAAGIDAAGDRIFVSQSHAESAASSSCAWAGTNANPVQVLGGNDAAEPPTSLNTGNTITISGTTFAWTGSVYAYGINWRFSSASAWTPTFNGGAGHYQRFEGCSFWITGAGGSSGINFGNSNSSDHSLTELYNCTFRAADSSQRIRTYRDLRIVGGSWASGGTAVAGVFTLGPSSRPALLTVDGFDFSSLGSTVNLVSSIAEGGARAVFRDCKLPASWTGSLVASGAIKLGSRVEMHNCDSADTHYRLWIEDYAGTIKTETTIVRSGGSSDGETALSHKMTTSANTAYPACALSSPEIVKWNSTVGSAITATVEIVHDSQGSGTSSRFTDAEAWLEVLYLGTSGYPLGAVLTDAKADVLATAADQTDSSETWTTTGLTTPLKQKLAVTFTPQEAGWVKARVVLAKASKTLYYDLKLALA